MSLVELTVTNDADGPRRVRIRSAVPVLPPRTRGVPSTGWTEDPDDQVAVLELSAGERRGLGYASSASAEPPAELVAAEAPQPPEEPEPVARTPRVEPTADGVVRDLPSPLPPRDAVPDREDLPDRDESDPPGGGAGGTPDGSSARSTEATPATTEGDGGTGLDEDSSWTWGGAPDEPLAEEELPAEVADWLDGVAARIDRAEALAAVDTVPAATERVAAVGGLGAVERLAERVEGDPQRLGRLAERAERLAERAEGLEVPVAALRRLS